MEAIFSIEYLESAIREARRVTPGVQAVAITIPPLYDPLRDLMLKSLASLRERTDNFDPRNIPWRSARFGTQRFCDVVEAELTDPQLFDFYCKVLTYASQPMA